MVATHLVVSAFFAMFTAALYAYVGWVVRRRRVAPDAQLAATLFSVWWFGLAMATALGATMTLLAAGGVLHLSLFVAVTLVSVAVLCVALWGFLYYLTYLYTGRSGTMVPITVFYIAYFLALTWFIILSEPSGILVDRWRVQLDYAETPAGWFTTAVVLLLVGPQLLAALGYVFLFFRVKGRTQRYRSGMVSMAVVAWFGSALVGYALGISTTDEWQVASRAIALAATIAILLAYKPPAWVQRRWGIGAIGEEPRPPSASG